LFVQSRTKGSASARSSHDFLPFYVEICKVAPEERSRRSLRPPACPKDWAFNIEMVVETLHLKNEDALAIWNAVLAA
jgi:hypothetical protein